MSEVLALRRTARSSLIGIMSSVPVTTLDALEQTNEVFRVVLLREQEVTLNSQVCQVFFLWMINLKLTNRVNVVFKYGSTLNSQICPILCFK